jgi:hypothetical protein
MVWADRSIATPQTFACALALLLLSPVSCRRHGETRTLVNDPELGWLGASSPKLAELTDDLAYVRAIARGQVADPPVHAVRARGRRVFVTFHRPHLPPLTTTGLGATLADALSQAAHLHPEGLDAERMNETRIQIDLVSGARPFATPTHARLGAVGVWAAPAFVLPSEPWLRRMLGEEDGPSLDGDAVDRLLARRDARGPRRSLFTTAVVESAAHDRALPLDRGRLARPNVDPALLRHRIALGAAYLARMTGDDGKLLYLYDLSTDRPVLLESGDDDYSVIRHAGATDALFSAYAELHDETFLAAGNRALAYLDRQLRTVDDARAYLPDEDNAMGTIGGTGLSLIAFAAHASATKDLSRLPRMRALGEFLVQQIGDDGKFRAYGEGGRDVLYYPGEAMLGLLRLHAVTREARWLEAAERVAAWRMRTPYADSRDWFRDFWFSLSLAELHHFTGKPIYAERAVAMAEAQMREQDEDEEDFARSNGAFGDTPRANPTSTMFEALATAARVTKDPGRILDHARRAASFVCWQQIDEESAYRARAPERALGGVPGNPWGAEVRIDDAQHAIKAMLALSKALTAPS